VKSVGVYLGGEGKNELGSWALDSTWAKDPYPGVVEALLGKAKRTAGR
jgi:hypothetical protein